MEPKNPPIFIIGTERSGSNLLRLILNTHSQIDIPHPPHIMRYLAHLEKYYDDLNDEKQFRRLVQDVISLIQAHIYPWDIQLDVERIAQNARSHESSVSNTFNIFYEVYEQHRKHAGKSHWGCKSTFMVEHTDAILKQCPNAKFIWLIRDPRDVAASSLTSVFNPFSPYYTAQLWNKQQQKAYALAQRLSGQVFTLKYENLLATPEQCIRDLCTFLNLPFEPQMQQFYTTPEANKGSNLSESWCNTCKPILKNNSGRFRQLLNQRQVQDVEYAAAEMMATLGYKPVMPLINNKQLTNYRKLVHLSESFYLGALSELRSLLRDNNYPLWWKRRIYLFTLKNRLLARHFVTRLTTEPVGLMIKPIRKILTALIP